MKFETIKNKKKLIIGVIAFCLIISAIIIRTTKAKYQSTQSINIAKGTINYELSDANMVGVYIKNGDEYTQSQTIPESGYTLNEDMSYCKLEDTILDTTIKYDLTTKTLSISPMTSKGTKCYLYFDEQKSAKDVIIANTPLGIGTPNFANTSCTSGCGEATVGLYQTEDDDGVSYYFRGDIDNNWVKFANFYWRIIRINGDGTIRMIYNGTTTDQTGESTQTTTIAFNNVREDNMYVGYMYTSGQVHGLEESSTIKGELDSWYDTNLASYESFIDPNAGFCGDRESTTSDGGAPNGTGGTGTINTYYAARYRLYHNKIPTLKCTNTNDLYTMSTSSKGNKALSKPIGLITADEVAYAGGGHNVVNTKYYLYTSQAYWTITPYSYYNSASYATVLVANKYMIELYVHLKYGVRPVINLKADTLFKTGSLGTASSPYEVI